MSDTDDKPGAKPFVLDYEGAGEGESDPGAAPPVPDILPTGVAIQAAARLAAPRPGGGVRRMAVWAFGALFSFVLSVAAYDFVANLLSRNAVLGSAAFALIVVAVGLALLGAAREVAAFARLGRLDALRRGAVAAALNADRAGARTTVAGLARLYAGRPDTAWGRAKLEERRAEVFDADGLLRLAEVEVLGPLDQAARREIEAAARQVALVTALVPLALADVAAALFANLRMIRRIAEIYGGRSGSLGSWRLLSRVFGHLVATGAVALTDDLLGTVAGGGVLSKVSRRFGEGVVNGALTARVGVAAMELCRPLPFVALPEPGVSNLVSRALTGLFGMGRPGGA